MNLKDSVVFITGANRGLGLAFAKAALAAFPTIDLDDVRGKKYRSPENAPKYINSRTSVHAEVVTDLNDTVSAVFVQFSYVGDDWIFFDKATIAAGDFRATPTFERPVRDNGGGKVWEHTRLLIDPDPNPALWAALPGRLIPAVTAEKMTGPKVIVRFEGSEYYKDYELKAWEKDSIKAALVLARKAPGRDDAIAALDAPEAVTSGP